MFQVGQFNWTTEQGGHGPIVLATGLWLLWREMKSSPRRAKAGQSDRRRAVARCRLLAIYLVARITGILEIEALAMYGALIMGAYLLFGGALIRSIWFPLLYLGADPAAAGFRRRGDHPADQDRHFAMGGQPALRARLSDRELRA